MPMRQWWMLQPYKHCLARLWQSCLGAEGTWQCVSGGCYSPTSTA